METKKLGAQTLQMSQPPVILGHANVVGKKEGEGPLKDTFDYIDADDTFGQPSWEKSESQMQKQALTMALEKAGVSAATVDFLFAGDLLNQCISSSYAAREQNIPFFGLYGACSTMGESIALASMTLDGGFGQYAAAVASSHFCSAERQYRNPLEYGSQRTPTAQWTVTGAGAVVLGRQGDGPQITHCTIGRIVDKGVCDVNNMGAAMAPAAAKTICAHLRDTGRSPDFYDRIITGDLGKLGSELLLELTHREGYDLRAVHADCGILIFDAQGQDVHCGGSGCGCCASVLTGHLLEQMKRGVWKNILFCPTGALHSPTATMQGESIPGICHAVALTNGK